MLIEIFQMINTRNNGRCVSLRPSRNISAESGNPIQIDLKDVWKNSGITGAYKVYLHEDELEFNIVHMVRRQVSAMF